MSEILYIKDDVRSALLNAIDQYVPNYPFLDNTYFNSWIDHNFRNDGKEQYTRNNVNELINSFVPKLIYKITTGPLCPWEEVGARCKEKFEESHKGEAERGGCELWERYIKQEDWSEERGCDLVDKDGEGIDIKLVTTPTSNVKIPGQFFDKTGIGFYKHYDKNIIVPNGEYYKWITHGYKKVWDNDQLPLRNIYDKIINLISYIKIDYPTLNSYHIYSLHDHKLKCIIRNKKQFEDDINNNIIRIEDRWDRRIIVTDSYWENGAVNYNFKQIKDM